MDFFMEGSKFQAGDKVRISRKSHIWNSDGKMDCTLGKIARIVMMKMKASIIEYSCEILDHPEMSSPYSSTGWWWYLESDLDKLE